MTLRRYCQNFILLLLLASSCSDETDTSPEINKAEKVYVIDTEKYGIRTDKTDAIATTDGINKAIEEAKANGYNTVKLPEGDYLIQCVSKTDLYATNGIFALTNMTLDFTGARLYVEPNSSAQYALIEIDHVENVTIRGGHIIGDMENHHWHHIQGYGIHVIASTNVNIENVKIERVTGDGIIFTIYTYMSFEGKFPSKNVKITGCEINNCNRQGIHAVQVKGLEISNNTFNDINGSNKYGIDINPNGAWKSVVENVKIHDNKFLGCSDAMRLWGGSNIEVYDNYMEKAGIFAIKCQRVRIYKNILTDNGSMYIGEESEDFCIPLEGDDKNICSNVTDKSSKTGNFPCP